MAQAESWLRVALSRFLQRPQCPRLWPHALNRLVATTRAEEFWRAALAAIPPGIRCETSQTGCAIDGSLSRAGPGETRRLLDPRSRSGPTPEQLVPLPSYKSPIPPRRLQLQATAAASLATHDALRAIRSRFHLQSREATPPPTCPQRSKQHNAPHFQLSRWPYATPSAPQVYTGPARFRHHPQPRSAADFRAHSKQPLSPLRRFKSAHVRSRIESPAPPSPTSRPPATQVQFTPPGTDHRRRLADATLCARRSHRRLLRSATSAPSISTRL